MKMRRTINEFLVGNITFPLTNFIFNRKRILAEYRGHIRSEQGSKDITASLKTKKLDRQLQYAGHYIPFYKERPKNIESLPLLSRSELVEMRYELVDRRFLSQAKSRDEEDRGAGAPISFSIMKKNKVVRNTSSGSTGAPTVFYEDGSVTAQNWSNELRVMNWFGLKPGVKQARFVRFTTDYHYNSKVNRMRRAMWNQLILPGVNLRQQDYPWMLERINAYKPKLFWGFTTAITGLAQYIKEQVITEYHRPELIVAWAAPLYDHEEELLKEVFNCSITNIYGMREIGHLGCRCPAGNIHIFDDSVHMEEIDGELVATPLFKTIMPLLRYRTGDLGKLTDEPCSCGRSSSWLKGFYGRTGESFTTNDGRMISPNFWCRTFMDKQRSQAVKRFQIYYRKDGSMDINIVRTAQYTDETEQIFTDYLEDNFGKETTFTFNYVDSIEADVSGKYQMVVKE